MKDGKSSVASAANFPEFQGLVGVSTAPDEAGQARSAVIRHPILPQRAVSVRPAEVCFPPFFETWPPWLGVGGHGRVVRDTSTFC